MEMTLASRIQSVKLKVVEDDAGIMRMVRVKLVREFDDTIAAALGGDAKKTLALLRDREVEKATIRIDAILCEGVFVANAGTTSEARVKIPKLRGLKAVCKAAKEDAPEDAEPSIELEWECGFAEDVWVFLGRHCLAWCEITLRSVQGELFSTPAPKKKGKSAGDGEAAH